MKELLQGKSFRQNLYKWIFMYIGSLALFTSVITYSKYYSSIASDDLARVAMFEVDMDYEYCVMDKNKCSTGIYSPTTPISYSFSVDAKLEVKTFLVLTMKAQDKFEIISLRKNGDIIYSSDTPNSNVTLSSDKRTLTLQETVEANYNRVATYQITVKYKETAIKDNYYIYDSVSIPENESIITVDYSAEQIK